MSSLCVVATWAFLLNSFVDLLGHFAEMYRRAVLPDDQEGVVAHSLGLDVGRIGHAPIAESVLADALRDGEPALDDLLVLVVLGDVLEMLEEAVDHL